MSSVKSKYTVQTLKKEHAKQVIDLFIRTFCQCEPLTNCLHMSNSEYQPFATEVTDKAVKDGLSTVALDEKNRVIAFIIVEDLADPFMPKLSHYPKMKNIFELLTSLSKPFVEGKKFVKGKVAHFWVAGVEPDYMHHGMFTELDEVTIRLAAKKGFNFAYAEFTNSTSEKVTHQFKTIELCNRINYEDFESNGQKPFKDVPGGAAAYCAAIKPGINLDSLKKCYTIDVTH